MIGLDTVLLGNLASWPVTLQSEKAHWTEGSLKQFRDKLPVLHQPYLLNLSYKLSMGWNRALLPPVESCAHHPSLANYIACPQYQWRPLPCLCCSVLYKCFRHISNAVWCLKSFLQLPGVCSRPESNPQSSIPKFSRISRLKFKFKIKISKYQDWNTDPSARLLFLTAQERTACWITGSLIPHTYSIKKVFSWGHFQHKKLESRVAILVSWH